MAAVLVCALASVTAYAQTIDSASSKTHDSVYKARNDQPV
jgi:hypothetical protein